MGVVIVVLIIGIVVFVWLLNSWLPKYFQRLWEEEADFLYQYVMSEGRRRGLESTFTKELASEHREDFLTMFSQNFFAGPGLKEKLVLLVSASVMRETIIPELRVKVQEQVDAEIDAMLSDIK